MTFLRNKKFLTCASDDTIWDVIVLYSKVPKGPTYSETHRHHSKATKLFLVLKNIKSLKIIVLYLIMPKGLTHNEIRVSKKSPNWSLQLKALRQIGLYNWKHYTKLVSTTKNITPNWSLQLKTLRQTGLYNSKHYAKLVSATENITPNWSLQLKTLSLWKKLRDSEKITKIVK